MSKAPKAAGASDAGQRNNAASAPQGDASHYQFKAIVATPGDGRTFDQIVDGIYEVADDATVIMRSGVLVADFSRPALNLPAALLSAVMNLQAVRLQIKHFEPDSVVTAAEIAERAHLKKASVSQYVHQQRLAAGTPFPEPVARVTTSSPVWDWVEVAGWLNQHGKVKDSAVDEAVTFRLMNAVIRCTPPKHGYETYLGHDYYWADSCASVFKGISHYGMASTVERVTEQLARFDNDILGLKPMMKQLSAASSLARRQD